MAKLSAPQVRFDAGVFVVELDAGYSNLYENFLENIRVISHLAASVQPARLVIDLGHVNFIGSAAIGLFVDASQTLRKRGGTFGLFNANPYCQTVISMAKLSNMLPCYGSIDDATAAATVAAK